MLARRSCAALLLALVGCTPASAETVAPRDAAFRVACADGCGKDARAPSVAIEVTFGGGAARAFSVCCDQRDELVKRLALVRDLRCNGLAVPPAKVGELTVGSTVSELSGKPAATLEQGEGYVAFQCGGWLPQLIELLERETCCTPRRGT